VKTIHHDIPRPLPPIFTAYEPCRAAALRGGPLSRRGTWRGSSILRPRVSRGRLDRRVGQPRDT
jgi:hypothetical protein